MKKKYFFVILLVLLTSQINVASAANYVVTSTADTSDNDGVSLRWAVTQAVFNTGQDTITFNIPGPAPHTILLSYDLPQIIGYDAQGTVIDGSTQPANGYTGTGPKIIVDGGGASYNGFDIEIPDCEVYGLVITRFQNCGILLTEDFIGGTTGNNFIIGAPGKGNVIYNMDTTLSPYVNGISVSVYDSIINGGKIQSNKIGTDTSGKISFPMCNGINLNGSFTDTLRNIVIGGSAAGEGNLISVQGAHLGSNIAVSFTNVVTIKGNIIGADVNGNVITGSAAVDGIYLTDYSDTSFIGGVLPGEGNIIAYIVDTVDNQGEGIQVQTADHCMIRRNSIYCNLRDGIELDGGNMCGNCFTGYPSPVITVANTAGASGTASPNDVIELFYNNTGCTHPPFNCSGEAYIATTVANGSGNWTYTGTFVGGTTLTATATSIDSSRTSAFADCFTLTAAPPPIASFSASDTAFCQTDCIGFTNLSQNGVTYQWIFTGAIPATSADVNPTTVCYDTAGFFDITLIAANSDGVSDTLILHNYIQVFAAPPTPVITQHDDTLFSSIDSSYISYQWYSDTAAIAGATKSYVLISAGGNYNVRVTNKNGCEIATGISITVGIPELKSSNYQFLISPNPVRDQFTVYGLRFTVGQMNIYNVLSQVCQQSQIVNPKSEIETDVSYLPPGIYFVRIQTENNQWVGKFLKE